MSIFSKILTKLGVKKAEDKETPATSEKDTKPAAKPRLATTKRRQVPDKRSYRKPTASKATAPMEMVDVMSKLESMGKGSGLNWKTSIVDLLKVLDIDSSLTSRKELAKELACPVDLMDDSAKMNTWLHKAVLKEVAKNGGNVPQDLLD